MAGKAGRPRKKAVGEKSFSSIAMNQNTAEKNIFPSENYEGINKIKGTDPLVIYENQTTKLFRSGCKVHVTLEQWCEIIYGWLMVNPTMLSVTDFYNYPKDNAPFMWSLDDVIEYDSDKIYNLLQERIQTCMLRRQVDREAALAVLREKYGWQRDNEQNINLNTTAQLKFNFGGETTPTPTDNKEDNE